MDGEQREVSHAATEQAWYSRAAGFLDVACLCVSVFYSCFINSFHGGWEIETGFFPFLLRIIFLGKSVPLVNDISGETAYWFCLLDLSCKGTGWGQALCWGPALTTTKRIRHPGPQRHQLSRREYCGGYFGWHYFISVIINIKMST